MARNASYPDQVSEDNIMFMLPLALQGHYAFVQPYINYKTDLTEYAFKIAVINNLELSGNEELYEITPPRNNMEINSTKVFDTVSL